MLFERAPYSGKRVAVIGGGPAGLSCAHRLAMLGHEVVVFEAREKMSGLNEYGIAAYKTIDDFAQREVEFILSLGGIKTRCGVSLGKDLKLSELKSEFDAVFLGIGLGNVNKLEIGDTPRGVFSAVDYIEDLRQASNLENLPVARRVIVIGGGSTAIDIAVQSKKLGAEDVTLVYRRGPENMSATNVEQEFAQVHDVKIRTWLQPNSWLVENGQLSGIRFEYTELNSSGKLMGKDEFLELETDSAFLALGQKMTHKIFELELEMNSGKLAVDENGATSQSGIWAGGDCITAGKDLTVHAVEQGKQAAIAMDQWLRN